MDRQRIIDHDGTAPGTGGIELWIRLGIALGVPREEMEDERHVLPAVRLICESYVTFCKSKPWQEAVRLFAHRAVRAQDSPAADRGVPPALPVDPARGPRLLQEPAGAGPAGREPRPPDRAHLGHDARAAAKVFEALAFKLEMLWAMIDTIHNAYREE